MDLQNDPEEGLRPRRSKAASESGPTDATMERLVRLVPRVAGAPAAMVTIGADGGEWRRWSSGLPDATARTARGPIEFCARIIESGRPLVLADASDPAAPPELAPGPGRGPAAYAGVPLLLDGRTVGVLCAMDFEPRPWHDDELDALEDLAASAVTAFRLRRDIREREAAEQRLADLLDGVRAIVWECDAGSWDFHYISPGVEEILGYPVQAWYDDAELWAATIHPEDRAWVVEACQSGVVDGQDSVLEYRSIAADGREVWLRDFIHVVVEDGEAKRLRGVMVDITREKQREERMRLLATVVHSLAQGVAIVDEAGRFVFTNPAYRRLLGPEAAEPDTSFLQAGLPDDDARRQLARIEADLAEGGSWRGRIRRIHAPTGDVRPVDVIAGRVEADDGRELTVMILHDASEEEEREQHLRRTERLAGLGTIVGGVAHELNNPLQAIRGFCELLLETPRPDDDRDALATIRHEAERAASVVSNLRVIGRSREEGGHGADAVDVNDAVRHILRLRTYSLTTRNINVSSDLAEPLPAVRAELGTVEQIVLNLVVNAEHALTDSPRKDKLLSLRTSSHADSVRIQVRDNGTGIGESELRRIFDPFFTTRPPGEGTGLGLTLVHSMVAELGGEIRLDSRLGAGTTFTVELPVVDAAPERGPPAAESEPRGLERRLRILVVDDERSIRQLLARYLERRGHRVDVAAEGRQALELVDDGNDYDVILSDLRMPGLAGDELFRGLRDRGGSLADRILFMTGDAASAEADRIVAETGAPVLVKPFEMEQVARRIEQFGVEVAAGGDTGSWP